MANELAARLKEAIRRKDEIPPRERFADMVRRGVIDREGRVLIRSPHVPDDHEAPAGPTGQPAAGNGSPKKRKGAKAPGGKAKKS